MQIFNDGNATSLIELFAVKDSIEIEGIKQFVQERHISSLYHFTHISNIENIQKHGLLEPKELVQRVIPHRNSGLREFLPNRGIFISISHPNDYMRFYKRLSLQTPLVVLEIEGTEFVKSALIDIPFIATPGNSSSSQVIRVIRSNPELFRGLVGLENQFLNPVVRERFLLDAHETTDPQSEIIFLGKIPSNYIKRWHIPEHLFDLAIKRFGDQDCFHKDYKISQGTKYDFNKAKVEKEERTWNVSWMR